MQTQSQTVQTPVIYAVCSHCPPQYVNYLLYQYLSRVTRFLTMWYSKTRLKRPLKRRPKKVFKTYNRLMLVKSIAECSRGQHSAVLLTCIKIPNGFQAFVLSIFKWSFKTCFTVYATSKASDQPVRTFSLIRAFASRMNIL